MNIKRGAVVSHTGAQEWGTGKVLEVTELKATIQFSDGIIRKIASSHYEILQPAARSSFLSQTGGVPAVASRVKSARQSVMKLHEV